MRFGKRSGTFGGTRMPVRIVAFSSKGCETAKKIGELFGEDCEIFSKGKFFSEGTVRIEGSSGEWAEDAFGKSDCIVVVGATGIAVRLFAPYIKDKKTDPAVICTDDNGKFVISLLSGHIGGANELAEKIAKHIGGIPVVTTSTDVNKKFAADVFSEKNGMTFRGRTEAKEISAAIIDGKEVGFSSDYPYTGNLPEGLKEKESGELGILISNSRERKLPFDRTLKLIPRNHVVGMGCRRDIPYVNVRDMFVSVLEKNDMEPESVRMIASIDLKKDETALRMLSEEFRIPLVFYGAEELNGLPDIGYSKSDMVRSVTGVDCVCERSAVMASDNGKLIMKKTAKDGVTAAVAREEPSIKFEEVVK